jgi:hypothetical protein
MFRLLARIIYVGLLLIEALVAGRFILLLINASSENTLVEQALHYSGIFVSPFRGIVDDTLALGTLRFDLTSIVALVFYMILAFVAMEMIKAFSAE